MVERAVRENWAGASRWPTRSTKQELIDSTEGRGFTAISLATLTAHNLMESSDQRAKARGAAIVTRMEGQNQSDEHAADPSKHLHLHGVIPAAQPVSEIVSELLGEHEYLEHLRLSALDSDPSTVCPHYEPGPLANGKTPGTHRPGDNGHAHGTNGKAPSGD